jgi:hypothetical protein
MGYSTPDTYDPYPQPLDTYNQSKVLFVLYLLLWSTKLTNKKKIKTWSVNTPDDLLVWVCFLIENNLLNETVMSKALSITKIYHLYQQHLISLSRQGRPSKLCNNVSLACVKDGAEGPPPVCLDIFLALSTFSFAVR